MPKSLTEMAALWQRRINRARRKLANGEQLSSVELCALNGAQRAAHATPVSYRRGRKLLPPHEQSGSKQKD